jgi:hypothetical protein
MSQNEPAEPGEHKATVDTPPMSSTTYDRLKFVALVLLPGLGALYVALSGFWGFPEPEKVAGSIMAVDTFLGLFLKSSSTQFKAVQQANDAREAANVQGVVSSATVNPDTGIPDVKLTITAPLEEVLSSDVVKLKVRNDLPPEHRIPG